MTRVLVAHDERNSRLSLMYILEDAGYEVIEAVDGPGALELAIHERPAVILLDLQLSMIDGLQVLKRLKGNPATRAVPVIVVTALPPEQGEQIALKLGVSHYISKPWEPSTIESAIRLALLEQRDGGDLQPGGEETDPRRSRQVVGTGNTRIDQLMEGGISLGSLTLLEGMPSAGKSVFCQHVLSESLMAGHEAAYFTSRHTPVSLASQMGELGLEVTSYLRPGQLRLNPIEEPVEGDETGTRRQAERATALLAADIEKLPTSVKVIIVDDATNLVTFSPEMTQWVFSPAAGACAKMGAPSSWCPAPTPSVTPFSIGCLVSVMCTSA